MKQLVALTVFAALTVPLSNTTCASEPPAPTIDGIVVSGAQKNLRVTPAPGAETYSFYSATNASGPFSLNTNFVLMPYVTGYSTNYTTNGAVTLTNLAYEWRNTNFTANSGFFRMSATHVSSNTTAGATVLNRLAYGPTPDELELYGNNPQAYIDQQLNFQGIPDTLNGYAVEITNAIPSDPTTNWTLVQITGRLNTTNLYIYMTAPGGVFIDDIQLTDTNGGPNLLANGDFESGSVSPGVLSGGMTASYVTNGLAHSGSYCLRVQTAVAGSTSGNNLRIPIYTNSVTYSNNSPIRLSFWYLPGPNSQKLTMRNGTGTSLIGSAGGIPPTPGWVYAQTTGRASTTSAIYIYLSGAGTAYVDDMMLVAGTNAGVGINLLQNGDFEAPLSGTWSNATDFTNSTISTTVAHSGNSSLQVSATAGGAGANDAIIQAVSPALANNGTYTVSYWYAPVTPGVTLTVRLSGSGLTSTPDRDIAGLNRRLENRFAVIGDYRAWFCWNAVNSPRQLLEVLSQFWENHFVTQYSKSRDYLDNIGYDSTMAGILATDWERREMTRWRNAMLNPNCTFYDLLKISAESPSMIVYLDSVGSRGDGTRVANENYARELLELFCNGVDNGYDQNDIILMSRAWTGWSVELVDAENIDNPFAPASVTYYPNTNSTSKGNTIGVWTFNFKPGNHGTNRGPIFAGKTVPARFGPPWAGQSYQLNIPPRATGSTNGIQDGYDVINHLANLPFTQEYISVKLCRLFVHDDFPNPTTIADHPEYAFYDYTNPDRSPEAELVHQCMLAWENSTPKGNIRAVLSTIFNSDLFRSHTAHAQKVKTPLEFVASAVRALKSTGTNDAPTAFTDGFSFATPLGRMGGMNLFDRGDPDGYPETAPGWISAGTLVERIRFVQSFLNAGTGDDAGNHTCDPVGLLRKKLPSGSWTDANAIANYFVSLLYPAEGAANLTLYRNAAVNFLNTADNGTTASAFSSQSAGTQDTRVRGMVAMLMTFQRFQEQ
ncbi:MAG TPA: DUF1800 family protein [Verrucomicrobiae bacterium]|nr:DUF1800 family protein [Verrucomicrobiae bacterium]